MISVIPHRLVSFCALLPIPLTVATASAETGASSSSGAAVVETTRPGLLGAFQVGFAVSSAGPVLFGDVPDTTLDQTTVFEYGGRLAFRFGDPRYHAHRFGVAADYSLVARSDARKLRFLTPQLLYQTGSRLALELGLGWAAGLGTAHYAGEYSGFYSGAELRYAFRQPGDGSHVGVTFGLLGRVVLAKGDLQQSSSFVGAQIEFTYQKGK